MGSLTKEYSTQKLNGQIYTPPHLVARVLDAAGYSGDNIVGARVLDPACGDGQFLIEVVRRILKVTPREELCNALQLVHGWDTDEEAIAACRARLDALVAPLGAACDWNVRVRNSLEVCLRDDLFQEREEPFRFVVGNPPYVRVQHLTEHDRALVQSRFRFCASGSTDLYIAFFELAFSLLTPDGIVAFITPNTYFNTATGRTLRRHLAEGRLRHVVNFGHRQVFWGATTYAAITVAATRPTKVFEYIDASGEHEKSLRVLASDLAQQDTWRFNTPAQTHADNFRPLKEIARVHVGLATLADSVFVAQETPKNRNETTIHVTTKHFGIVAIERELLRPVIKGSLVKRDKPCYNGAHILFPYHTRNKRPEIISEEELIARYPLGYAYLKEARFLLDKRDNGKVNAAGWYAFGRTQALKTSFGEKIIFPPIACEPNFAVCRMAEATVYSGYFIKYDGDLDALAGQLNSERMHEYAQSGGRDYQGGWKGYSKASLQDFPIDVSQL